MDSATRLVSIWMSCGGSNASKEIAEDISAERITLLNVVEALKEYLTSEENELRTKGVELLSSVLVYCPPETLNRQSTRVLAAFYCDKLNDTETIAPALKGLVSLTRLPSCVSSDVVLIIRAIFLHINMKTLHQSTRFLVLSIIDILMASHREALKDMGNDFLSGYINLAENEKDPRNLLLAFAITRVILVEFKISDHVGAFFNITFCYFPITFRPPSNDQNGITTDHLKRALHACLNATPAFGQLAIPVFLEKLIAGSPVTKRDTLQAMSSCLPVYGAAVVRSFAFQLWSTVKLEIFQSTDPITEAAALDAVESLIKSLHSDDDIPEDETNGIHGLVYEVCEECTQIFREPEKNQAKRAMKVLRAFISTTPSVSRYTISHTVPYLVKLFLDPSQAVNRPPILILLSDLVTAARDMAPNRMHSLPNLTPLLLPLKKDILGVEVVGLKSPACRLPALDGLKGMVTTKALLTDEELCEVVRNVTEALDVDSCDDDVSDAILDLLSTLSGFAPWHIRDQTLPLLFNLLPDHGPTQIQRTERAKCTHILSALSKLCLQPELFESLVVRLITKLDLLCLPSSAKHSNAESNAAYAHSVLATLSKTLSVKADKHHADVSKYVNHLVPALYSLFMYSSLSSDKNCVIGMDPRLVNIAAHIITLIVRTLPLSRQKLFATALFSAFLMGDIDNIVEGYPKISLHAKFLPFDTSAPVLQKNLVALFAAGVIAFRKELQIPVPNLNEFLNMLMHWSLSQAENALQRDSVWQLIASVVNKQPDDVTIFLSRQLDLHPQNFATNSQCIQIHRHIIKSRFWISKALSFRGHTFLMPFIDCLFDLFDEQDVSWTAAKTIGRIGGHDPILAKLNHSVVKILHAQKYVDSILPRLVEGANAIEGQRQTSCVVALSILVKSVPKSTYSHFMPPLMPLLIRGLDLPDHDIQANIIDTLADATEGDLEPSTMAEYASTLVSAMLKKSSFCEMPSVRVRVAALHYLAVLPSVLRYDILHPHRSSVIRELSKVLDDPKRLVRKAAVHTRTIWFDYNG